MRLTPTGDTNGGRLRRIAAGREDHSTRGVGVFELVTCLADEATDQKVGSSDPSERAQHNAGKRLTLTGS